MHRRDPIELILSMPEEERRTWRACRLDSVSASAPAAATLMDATWSDHLFFDREDVYARSSIVTHNNSALGEKNGR